MRMRLGRLLGVAVVCVWAILFVRRVTESFVSIASARLIDLTVPSQAELSQRGVFYRGSRIGHIRERMMPIDSGFRAEQEGSFTLTVLGRQRRMQIEGSANLDKKGTLEEFQFRLTTSSRRSPFSTTVKGEIEGDQLTLRIINRERERVEIRELTEPIVLPLNLYYSLASLGFTPGLKYRVRLFDPMTLSDGPADVEVMEPEIVRWGGREEEAFRLKTTFSGLTTTAWVNEVGEVLREETPLGWKLIKEAPESSLNAQDDSEPTADIMVASAMPAIGFVGSATTLSEVTLKLRGFPAIFDGVSGGRQVAKGDRVTIRREAQPLVETDATLADEELEQALAASAFIQSDDAEIKAKAAEIAGGLSKVEAARAISDWVHQNLAKSPTLSIPSATEILEQRVGDCNEHTVLFTALARAANIPTRMATGLAYTRGQFYYHAWPEVWVGQWVALDPTFGQFPADSMHLRLLTGGLENQYEILTLMSREASIEVLEAKE